MGAEVAPAPGAAVGGAPAYSQQAVPIMEAFRIAVAWVAPGTASALMPIPQDVTSGRASPPAGLIALIADTASGNALGSAGNQSPSVTVGIHIDVVDALPTSGTLRCDAQLTEPLSHDKPLFVEAVVVDDRDDRLVARTGSWWLAGNRGKTGRPAILGPAGCLPETEAPSSLQARFGLVPERGEGTALVTAHNIDAYLNRRHVLHGGAMGMLAELAAEEALASIGNTFANTLSLGVDYLAPTGVDGAPVRIESAVVRAGMQIAVVESRLLTGSGDVAGLVTLVRSR